MEEDNNPIKESGVKTENYTTTETTQSVTSKKQNNMCLISFIISLVGLIVFAAPCGIASVIVGIVGLVKFDSSKEKGKGLGIAGIVIGAIDAIVGIINIVIQTSL